MTTIPFSIPKPQTSTQLRIETAQKPEPISHKFIEIKPITITEGDKQKLDRLILTNTRRFPKSNCSPGLSKDRLEEIRYNFLMKVTRICTHCSNLAEYQVSYDCNGAILIKRYCSTCLEEEKKKGNIERDY